MNAITHASAIADTRPLPVVVHRTLQPVSEYNCYFSETTSRSTATCANARVLCPCADGFLAEGGALGRKLDETRYSVGDIAVEVAGRLGPTR